jgi:hypothetical protein
MQNLSGTTILIVGETPDVSDLRTRLVKAGATVHVVSVAGASLMVRQKQVDSAFIAATLDEGTQQLCAELDSLGIARVFLTPSAQRLSRGSWVLSLRTCAVSCGLPPSPEIQYQIGVRRSGCLLTVCLRRRSSKAGRRRQRHRRTELHGVPLWPVADVTESGSEPSPQSSHDGR